MPLFDIDPSLMPPESPDRVANICWLAREVLATFMDEGHDLIPDEDDKPAHPDDLYYDGGEEGLTIHDTGIIVLNTSEQILLSNLPFLLSPSGNLVPHTEPGYVALRLEPFTLDPAERVLDTEEGSEQVIFRLPIPDGEGAAIFEGHSFSNVDQISSEDTAKLDKLEWILTLIKRCLRTQAEESFADFEASYHGTIPRKTTSQLVDKGLLNLLGE